MPEYPFRAVRQGVHHTIKIAVHKSSDAASLQRLKAPDVPEPTRIAQTFASLKQAGHMAFMPFLTAGDPNIDTTLELIRELSNQKVDLIEIGFPYSDPIADGPVIQASYTRVLNSGMKVDDIFNAVATLDHAATAPLVAMVSYAIVFRAGPQAFVERCQQSGFAGLIIPDLPGDEAEETSRIVQAAGLDLVELIAPTTPPERADKIVTTCSGFVYCVSIAGTTGVRSELPKELSGQLESLRSRTDLPLAVGFGISQPEQVDALRGYADGVIVGSAIVRRIEEAADAAAAVREVGQFAAAMVAATHQ